MAKPMTPAPKPKKRRHFIAQWREKRGLSQDVLAERIDRSRGLISQIENGKTAYTEETLGAIADALQCEPWDLLNVNPLKEGKVIDIMDLLRTATPEQKSEAFGYIQGLVRRQ